jgi:hypothetical protein
MGLEAFRALSATMAFNERIEVELLPDPELRIDLDRRLDFELRNDIERLDWILSSGGVSLDGISSPA